MEYILEANNISKSYGDFSLKNISLSLPPGYIMGLIGPNGAGKTSIIKIIMNLIMKDQGEVKIFGKDHHKDEIAVKKRIGFVYDNPIYYEHLSLKKLKDIIAPFYDTWDERAFKDLVDRFNLPLNKAIRKFSKGMAMKGAIAIALSHNADLIIMDEPTSGLDPVIRRELLDFFRELIQDGRKSILFSSHITTDIEQVADYITYILDGEVVFSKSKEEVFEQYALVKGSNDLLNDKNGLHLIGFRSGAYGFEGLTKDRAGVEAQFGDRVIYDNASLEDIMFFSNKAKKVLT